MDKQAKIAQLESRSVAFEVDLTLDEIEWTRVLGPVGYGAMLLESVVELGADLFDIGGLEHYDNTSGEVFAFEVEGKRCELRLEYDQPFTARLLSGVRTLLDGVNRALRRATIPVRYVCVRDSCDGAGCTYRLMLVPAAWLDDVREHLHVVAGLCPEDYEATLPFWRSEGGDDFLELR